MSSSTRIELMTNAVVAQYIHEISVRHRPRARASERQADAGTIHAAHGRATSSARRELNRLASLASQRPARAALPAAC